MLLEEDYCAGVYTTDKHVEFRTVAVIAHHTAVAFIVRVDISVTVVFGDIRGDVDVTVGGIDCNGVW